MSDIDDKPSNRLTAATSEDRGRVVSAADAARTAGESEDEREQRIVRSEFEGLDNDLVDVARFAGDRDADEGSGPVDIDETGVPDETRTDTADLSVSEYDRSNARR